MNNRSIQRGFLLSPAAVFFLLMAGCSVGPEAPATYVAACAWCHDEGIGGAPKTGDKEEWERRTGKGIAKVYANAINGFEGATGIMPARGSRMDLSDEEIRKLVDYMVAASQ
jgi:cytochrome c